MRCELGVLTGEIVVINRKRRLRFRKTRAFTKK